MRQDVNKKGFSLIEILVSLVVVSLAAVNITGLQKKAAQQHRDNLFHSAVITIATEKMESQLRNVNVDTLIALDNVDETGVMLNEQAFSIHWTVDKHAASNDYFSMVNMDISWKNSQGKEQHFIYSVGVNNNTPTISVENTQKHDMIESVLNTNQVLYFNPNMNYQTASFIIYNSHLYQATDVYIAGDAPPSSDAGRWQNYGAIDNSALTNLPYLATYFLP